MLIVIPVSLSDRHLIPFVERAFEMFPPGSGHKLLVVGSPNVYTEVKELTQKLCGYFAGNGSSHIFDTDSGLGWPTACNQYFSQTVFHIPNVLSNEGSWLWFELDSTPIKENWLDAIEAACTQEKAEALREQGGLPKFFGVKEPTHQEFRGELLPGEQSGEHMAAVGVYPADMYDWVVTVRSCSATNIPFYIFCQWYITPHLRSLSIIQNNWRTNCYERTPDGQLVSQSIANWAWDTHFNKPIAPGVVLVHGCKDGSLTDLLKVEHEALKEEGIPAGEYWTDAPEEPEPPPEPKKKKPSQDQVRLARERMLKMHEARRKAEVMAK